MSELELTDAKIKQIAALAVSGRSNRAISTELKITEYAVAKIKKSEQFKNLLKEMTESIISDAQAELKHEIAKRSKQIIDALDEELAGGRGRMEAIKTALKVLSVLDPKENNAGDSGPLVVKFDLGDKPMNVVELPGNEVSDE